MSKEGWLTMPVGVEREEVKDSSAVGLCPDCGAWLIRTHFEADKYEFEHWVDRCLSCGYGHEFKRKDGLTKGGLIDEWFQHPHKRPSHAFPPDAPWARGRTDGTIDTTFMPGSLATDTKLCPACGKFMIRWTTGEVAMVEPAHYAWIWRCGCGHEEPGGVEACANLFWDMWGAANRRRPL